jgi:hypothetical protein
METFRTIRFFLRNIAWRKKTALSFSSNVDKKPNKIKYVLGMIGGFFYSLFQRKRESLRLIRRKQERRKTEYTIPLQIIHYSKEIFGLLVIAFLISLSIDWGLDKIGHALMKVRAEWFWRFVERLDFLTLPDRNFMKLLLEISIGAISAILGLIFALYAVGFQISTEKYSSKVSDYVNQETVGNFFFKLLVFTDLFAILTLLRVELLKLQPGFSFISVMALVTICLLGIVVFKNHYILTIKSKNLFERLLFDIRENIWLVSDRRRYSYNSWSIVQTSRVRTQELLALLKALFEDLWQAKNWNDIIYAPTVLSYALTEYANRKKFIDKERGWWYPQRPKEVKASDMTSLPLKLNYELQGQGPLRIGSPDYLWFEDQVFEILQTVESRMGTNPDETHLLSYVIQCYQTILSGAYSKDQYGRYQKTTNGLYESQEIDAFEKYFDAYLALYDKVKTEDELGAYLNGYFALGLILINGFDYSNYQPIIKSLIGPDGKLAHSRREIAAINLPYFFYNQLLDYWDRLDLEAQCEGKIVTPQHLLEKETSEDAQTKEKQYFDNFFNKLCKHHDTILDDLYKKGKHKELAQFLKVRFEWFSRMLYVKKTALAEQYSSVLARCAFYLLTIPKQILLDTEFWEEIEKLIFPSVIEDCPSLFKGLAQSLVLLLPAINVDEKNVDNIMYRNRLLIVIGGFVYLVSEFRRNNKFLTEYVQIIEKAYQEGYFIQMIEMLAKPRDVGGRDLTHKLISWEITRYHHWFRDILRQIHELPKTYDRVRFYYGMQEVADHSSQFIREMSYRTFNPEEESTEAFVEWAKKREMIKKLLTILQKIRQQKT